MRSALLLSGGVDSIALLHRVKPAIAITINYGQSPAPAEIDASAAACQQCNIEHVVLNTDCREIGAGLMANANSEEWMADLGASPEWWPFRNQLVITIGAAHAVRQGIKALVIGTVLSDSCHKDGSTGFVDAMDGLLQAQEGELRLLAPAIGMSSVELVRWSGAPRSLIGWAHSCHTGVHACGWCRGCIKRFENMQELGWG